QTCALPILLAARGSNSILSSCLQSRFQSEQCFPHSNPSCARLPLQPQRHNLFHQAPLQDHRLIVLKRYRAVNAPLISPIQVTVNPNETSSKSLQHRHLLPFARVAAGRASSNLSSNSSSTVRSVIQFLWWPLKIGLDHTRAVQRYLLQAHRQDGFEAAERGGVTVLGDGVGLI